MESILKSDIFFFITSICMVVFTIIFLIAGIYFIKIVKNFYKISKILRMHVEEIDDNLRDLGEHIRNSKLFIFLFGKEKVKNEKGATNSRNTRRSI
jgi:MFS-type transporter involved in bile tolerance (Atg22 family)